MNAVGLGLFGVAVLALPAPTVTVRRMRSVWAHPGSADDTPPRRDSHHPGRVLARLRARAGPLPVGTISALVGILTAGPAVGLAAAVTAMVCMWLLRSRGVARHRRGELDAMLESLAALTGELRAGGTPEAALWAGVAVASGASAPHSGGDGPSPDRSTRAILETAAATASLGGDASQALRVSAARCQPELGAALRRIAAGWQVSEHSGAPLAGVLDRVEGDLRAGRRHARQLDAQLAGPRATGAMLALLPGLGLLLGVAMGAHPVAVLVGTGAGRLALVLGVGLDAAGVLWTARLLRSAR